MLDVNIISAQYVQNMEGVHGGMVATIDGVQLSIPLDPANRHYAEIMRQVEAGTLTIAEAD
jgi:hypothetical protein